MFTIKVRCFNQYTNENVCKHFEWHEESGRLCEVAKDSVYAAGMTQNDFASAIGITQSFVSYLRTGKAALSVSLAKDIERTFPEYRAAWLLGLDERPDSKVEALEVLNPIVSDLSPERRDALLEHVQDFIKLELRKEMG